MRVPLAQLPLSGGTQASGGRPGCCLMKARGCCLGEWPDELFRWGTAGEKLVSARGRAITTRAHVGASLPAASLLPTHPMQILFGHLPVEIYDIREQGLRR